MLVHPLPPLAFWCHRRFVASAFDADVLRAWAKRATAAGCVFWLHRGRLVSQAACEIWGPEIAWQHAGDGETYISLDLTTTPPTLGPA